MPIEEVCEISGNVKLPDFIADAALTDEEREALFQGAANRTADGIRDFLKEWTRGKPWHGIWEGVEGHPLSIEVACNEENSRTSRYVNERTVVELWQGVDPRTRFLVKGLETVRAIKTRAEIPFVLSVIETRHRSFLIGKEKEEFNNKDEDRLRDRYRLEPWIKIVGEFKQAIKESNKLSITGH